MAKIGLEQAVDLAHEFFKKQCLAKVLGYWELVTASEDVDKGAYVIHCREACLFEKPRGHEIWIDAETGKIEHTHRLRDLDKTDLNG